MDRAQIIGALRAHEAELRAAGIERLAIFGSVVRGDEIAGSDLDVLVRLNARAREGGFAYFGRLDALARQLSRIVGRRVDLVPEPVRKERLRRSIEKESAVAF